MIRKLNAFNGIKCCFSKFLKVMIWLGAFTSVNLFAQQLPVKSRETDSINRINQLKEVQISTIKISRRQTSSTPLQILSGAELERLNSLSVADAVRFFSGVQLKDYGGIGGLKTINVRSMGSNHTAVFYDGVQLGNAQNGQVDLGKYSLDNIDEIELYNGQKSAVFQSAKGFASGSSLYLKVMQPEFEAGRSNKYRFTLKGGSFGLFNPSLLWQSKITERIYSSVSAEWKNAHGRYRFRTRDGGYDSTGVRTGGDLDAMRLEVGVKGTLADSSKWTLRVYGYNDKQGLPGAIVANVWHFSQRQWSRNLFIQTAYEKKIGNYSVMAAAKYANDYLRYLNPDVVSDKGFLDNRFHQQEWYGSLANKLELTKHWDVVLSVDYQLNKLDANLYRFAYPTRSMLLTALASQLKFDRFDIQANVLSTYVKDEVKAGPGKGSRNEFTPTIMLSWQPFNGKEFRLRTFYKDIFRMPTFNDLYYTFYGYTQLKAEYTKQYDVGFTYIKAYERQVFSQFSVQTDVYYNSVKNKIVAVPNNTPARWGMQNIGLVSIKGIDVNMQSAWQLDKDLDFTSGISYTYQRAIDADQLSPSYRDQIPYVPVHNVSFLAGVTYKRIAMNYSFIYTGERYNQSTNNVYNYVRPWYTHDVALHYNLNKNARIAAEVNNLLDQDYEVLNNYPMPGRSYRFTLTYNY